MTTSLPNPIAGPTEIRSNAEYRALIEEDPEQRGSWRVRMQRLKNGQARPVHTHTGLATREAAIRAADEFMKKMR
jgi:hypothetical protein